jgi:hypothetical protein
LLRLTPQRLGSGRRLWIGVDDQLADAVWIEPHIPLLDREHQTKGFFTRA